MTTNTGFVVTDIGNAAASTASPGGPYIHITQFMVTDAFNWTPDGTEEFLPGTVKYVGQVANYYVVSHDQIELILFMDSTVGPFDFGTVGIFLSDGTLFASMSFSTIQEKIRAVGNQAGTQWRIRARLQFARASVICQVDVITTAAILEVASWPYLVTPINQTGNSNMAIVKEMTPFNNSVLVYKTDDDTWSIADFEVIFQGSTQDVGGYIGTSVIRHPNLASVDFVLPQVVSRYLIKFPDGDIRKITSANSPTELVFASPKAVPLTGDFTILEDSQSRGARVRWADRQEYNDFVNAFNPLWTVPSGAYSANNEGLNQNALTVLTSPKHPSRNDWSALHNAVIAKCKLHNVDYSGLAPGIDYSYTFESIDGWGIKTIRDKFDNLLATISPLTANRNTINASYLESVYPVGGAISTNTQWSGSRNHYITFTYMDTNTLWGMVNGGHAIELNASVATGNNANWTALKSFLTSIGTVTIKRGTTVGSGIGTGSAIGFYGLTGVDQTLFTATAAITGGNVTYAVLGRILGAVVSLTVEIIDTATAGSETDLFLSQSRLYRPSSTIINTPILPWPLVTSTTDLTAASTPAPTSPPGAIRIATSQSTNVLTTWATTGSFSTTWLTTGTGTWYTSSTVPVNYQWATTVPAYYTYTSSFGPGPYALADQTRWTADGGAGHNTFVLWVTQYPATTRVTNSVGSTTYVFLTSGDQSWYTSNATAGTVNTSVTTTWTTTWNTSPIRGTAYKQGTVNGTTLLINKPTGVVANDLLVALVAGATSVAGTFTGIPAGWTLRGTAYTTTLEFAVATLLAGSGEPASYTFTSSQSASLGGVILAFEDLRLDVMGTVTSATAGGALTVPAITPISGSLIYLAVFDQSASVTVPNVTGWTEVPGVVNSDVYAPSWRVFERNSLGDGSSTGTVVVDTSATSGNSAAVMFSVKLP